MNNLFRRLIVSVALPFAIVVAIPMAVAFTGGANRITWLTEASLGDLSDASLLPPVLGWGLSLHGNVIEPACAVSKLCLIREVCRQVSPSRTPIGRDQ